jgi:Leucine-rich repeat (LRR) protein
MKQQPVGRMTSPLDPMDVARARIAEEAERRTGSLDLSGLGLEALPKELADLTDLQTLDCSGTPVTDLSPLAKLLRDLKVERTEPS